MESDQNSDFQPGITIPYVVPPEIIHSSDILSLHLHAIDGASNHST